MSPGSRMYRFPFEPIAAICRARYQQPNGERPTGFGTGTTDGHVSVIGNVGIVHAVLAPDLRVCPKLVNRWQREGLTYRAADRVAVALGYHPANIWPEWWRT